MNSRELLKSAVVTIVCIHYMFGNIQTACGIAPPSLMESINHEKSNNIFLSRTLFTLQEIDTITAKILDLNDIFHTLSVNAQKILLCPDVLLTLIGIKPAYLRYEDEPSIQPLIQELWNSDIDWAKKDLFPIKTTLLFSKKALFKRLREEGEYLVKCRIITSEQLTGILENRDIKTFTDIFDKWYGKGIDRKHIIAGFMFGYPIEDIEYAVWHYDGTTPSDDQIQTNDYTYGIMSAGSSETLLLLRRWSSLLDFAYYSFERISDLSNLLSPKAYTAYNMHIINLDHQQYTALISSQ